ncbi:MAG: hypothetical protein K9K63_01790 [Desulfotignum sp.]|nr:hypothetical protein [Desulfotignum sp.]MCF8088194.1 hypothetical protein [Desulfotignum sp.]MCF8136023.1 hypothetical protein [Desulfotignum sp.]
MSSFIRLIQFAAIAAGVIWFCCPAQTVFARNQVITHVQVIQASTQSRSIDPALRRIVPELEKVFRYTGYTLLQDKTLSLAFQQPGRIDLPDRRTLVLTPTNSQGGRIQYDIRILNRNEAVFQTRVLLKNNRSMTIGGPRFGHGVLLFHITGSLP